jgi:hypothetical protein
MDISKHPLVQKGYIPLDKSWMIRIGFLATVFGSFDDYIKFTKENYSSLSDDLKSSYQAFSDWRNDKKIIRVGESATLYRFLKFASWKYNLNKKFKLEGTLVERDKTICNNPKIINYSPEELLKLDNETSQWASAAYLLGDYRKVKNPPYKLQLTYDVVEWIRERKGGLFSELHYDETILRQAEAFVKLIQGKNPNFKPLHSEDGPFACIVGNMTTEEYKKLFPTSETQESNRPEEVKKEFYNIGVGRPIESPDHRIVQAGELEQMLLGIPVSAKHPSAVGKSWPQKQFERFLHDAKKLKL